MDNKKAMNALMSIEGFRVKKVRKEANDEELSAPGGGLRRLGHNLVFA